MKIIAGHVSKVVAGNVFFDIQGTLRYQCKTYRYLEMPVYSRPSVARTLIARLPQLF